MKRVMGVGAKIVCLVRLGDHFSAIRGVSEASAGGLSGSFGGGGWYHLIPITLVRMALHPLFLSGESKEDLRWEPGYY